MQIFIYPLIMQEKKRIDICLSPALFPLYNYDKNAIVIVVDIFRATTSMCVAFCSGVKSILPVADIEEAKALKQQGFLVGAERNVAKCDFADFGNSPFDYMDKKLSGKEIVMTTTNGTSAINVALSHDKLLIGSFSNFSYVASYCTNSFQDIVILCSGWNNHINYEDSLFAGALAENLIDSGFHSVYSDEAHMAMALWNDAKYNVREFLNSSEHIQRLILNGLEKDIDFCLTLDTTTSLPVYDKEAGKLLC